MLHIYPLIYLYYKPLPLLPVALESSIADVPLLPTLFVSPICFLQDLLKRPKRGMTEMRRDGKDDAAVGRVIRDVVSVGQILPYSKFSIFTCGETRNGV